MIIWINGTYGVGKTSTALKICEKLKNKKVELISSDYYYQKIIKEIVELGGGVLPQNNKLFLSKFKEIVEQKIFNSPNIIIIDMAITQKECKEELFDYFNKEYKDFFHFILTAQFETVQDRISMDDDRANEYKDDALYYLNENVMFLSNNFQSAIWIDTNNKNIDEIAIEIIQYIKTKRY